MKRIKFFIGAVLLAAVTMFAAGCEQDNAEPTNVSDNTARPQDTIPNTPQDTIPNTPTDYNAEDWVDLGLPSGLLWATRNVGASRPEDYGDYFAWGETTPKDNYSWETYRYANGNKDQLTKYCNYSGSGYNGFSDNLTTLQPSDDAAKANISGSWMPTFGEWQELLNNCTWTWTTRNGVNGYQVKGPNGERLFLPAAGNRWDGNTLNVGSYGYYWSSSLFEDRPYYAWYLGFNSVDVGWSYNDRDDGFSVRPVRSAR